LRRTVMSRTVECPTQRDIIMVKHLLGTALLSALGLASAHAASAGAIGVNVLLDRAPTSAILAQLGAHGTVRDVVPEIHAVTLKTTRAELPAIRALPHVVAANPDAKRQGAPIDTVSASSFSNGISTWDLDSVDVTDRGVSGRTVTYDGSGVYVAVIDTGLLDSWRQYFPQQRIATEFATGFSGGGGDMGNVSEPTHQWEHDQNSHGTHVVSTIIGYNLLGTPVNGVAPQVRIIPVKVLRQSGSGWSSVVARGITYVADLKASGQLGNSPVVINMSLGGPSLDAMEKAAIDYAERQGVVVVAAAGNDGTAGMDYPGAYAPVISAAASGWRGQWRPGADGNAGNWWNADNVPDPTDPDNFYIADFSSREGPGQDLDVAAPGSWVVGPYQTQSGKTSYYFLSGTSMASPHVAGIAALMLQKQPRLTPPQVESILEASALPMAAGCATIALPAGNTTTCWGADATGHGITTAQAALDATP
jgi:subtilisin family serine protease